MVIESLVNPMTAERRPWVMIFLGFMYSIIAMGLSYWIFEEYASLVMVFLTVLACAPLMYQTVRHEELVDLENVDESNILWEHAKALHFLLYLFFGITLAYASSYLFFDLVLPSSGLISTFFTVQKETITTINAQVVGNAVEGVSVFGQIFFNNLWVLIFCLLFSLVFGLGAIFILVWNGSVIGVALGNFISSKLGAYSSAVGFAQLGAYLHVTSWGVLRYAIHGVPEILAYFIAGLAGGIISIAIARHDFGTKKLERILLDASDLIIISIVILILAAGIEVFITPLLF